ncbi:MAG: hypothetical protein ACP5M0_11150 [Desulfomonilaceae bacterium]
MSKQREKIRPEVKGGMLIGRGDVIQVMDEGTLTKCEVISCLAAGQDGCLATLEILEGPRKGQRIQTKLRLASESDAEKGS